MTRPCAICGGPMVALSTMKKRCHMCSSADRRLADAAIGTRMTATPRTVTPAALRSLAVERAVAAHLRAIRARHLFTLTTEDIYAQRGGGGASPPDDYAGITEAFRGARERSADDRHRQVQARKRQRREREAAGQCIRCAHPVTAPHVYCDHCRHKESVRARGRRAAAKVAA